jgi:hypothetical protein
VPRRHERHDDPDPRSQAVEGPEDGAVNVALRYARDAELLTEREQHVNSHSRLRRRNSRSRDTLVVKTPYADSTQLTLMARPPDGSIDPRFGSHGRVRIHTPWRGQDAALGTEVSVIE